jgi:hypothetical protein
MMKALYRGAMFYTIAGLFFGVFYREFTKMQGFTGKTMLSILHVHTLTLGLLFFLILMLMEKQFTLTAAKRFKGWFITYNVALVGTLASMLTRGVIQVLGTDISGLNHIAGTFHTLMAVALVWFLVMLKKRIWE